MSINVTVTGNPVRVKRGRMVTTTTACDPNRQEFDKRRLLRLEQVRQQSKDIAENIRNKVRKEKSGRSAEIEREGEVKLQNWQARKLLELQNQYQDALNDIGLGHKQAESEEKREEVFSEKRKLDDRIAKDRGREAAERVQIEKNQANLKNAVPIQQKKLSRDAENTRSANKVSSLRKSTGKSPSKKAKRDKKPESENIVPRLEDIASESQSQDLDSSDYSDSEVLMPSLKTPKSAKTKSVEKVCKEAQTSLPPEKIERAAQTQPESVLQSPMITSDNRISERIKRRSLLNPERQLDEITEREIPSFTPVIGTHQAVTVPCNCCKCPERPNQPEIPQFDQPEKSQPNQRVPVDIGIQKDTYRTEDLRKLSTDKMADHKKATEELKKKVQRSGSPKKSSPMKKPQSLDTRRPPQVSKSKPVKEIPTKPRVTLRAARPTPVDATISPTKVRYYDHPNRFTKYGPSTSRVDRIDEESLVISPNLATEEDLKEEMRKRDLEAHSRGLQALEKEKISREYNDLLKKLPALQKQERICDINGDKAKYHMPDDRLEEYERKRQNQMDNAYEKLFTQRKPATVTLPKVNPKNGLSESPWDVDFRDFSGRAPHKDRSRQLNDLLDSLRSQKENLLKEIEGLPESESVASLLEDLTSTTLRKKDGRDKKRKRDKDDRAPSPPSFDSIGGEGGSRSTFVKRSKDGVSASGSYPSPRKKPKIKTVTKVLQNMSTQTTPKPVTADTKLSLGSTKTCGTCLQEDEPCFCDQASDLCEILIKIKEGDQPEVTVNPPSLGQNVKIVTVDETASSKSQAKDQKDSKSPKDSSKTSVTVVKKAIPLKPPNKKSVNKSSRASWRDQLSQMSSISTTSTSYFSPPEFFKSLSSTDSSTQIPRAPPRNVRKPTNNRPVLADFSGTSSTDASGNVDPRLLTYIKKLLNMSHATVDDLSVSDGSGVSTPSQSVIEMPTNNPMSQLRNVMKYFNLDPVEVKKQLSVMSDSTPHFNTSESGGTVTSKSDLDPPSFDLKTKEQLAQYADLADSCNRKISSLTAMIEKVREEKEKMLQSPPGSNNNSTSYLELPQSKLTSSLIINTENNGISKENTPEISPIGSRDEMDKNLLDVDVAYAEKLKLLTPAELQEERKRQEESLVGGTDEELLKRLKRLLGENNQQPPKTIEPAESDNTVAPMLNIPKLPKLKSPSAMADKKRPPPVKSVKIVQKLNGNYSIPHELSTIVEADSQLSTKVEPTPRSSMSPDKKESALTVEKNFSPSITENSSDEKSDLEAMESMLHSIGMEWAIPTLRKTREALALSSSSSDANKSSKSDISLKAFLTKNLIASSSLKSNGSPLGLSGEIQDISVIQYEQHRRTSTPAANEDPNNLDPLKKVGFSEESDLSSVKVHSCECSSKSESLSDGKELKFYDLNDDDSLPNKT